MESIKSTLEEERVLSTLFHPVRCSLFPVKIGGYDDIRGSKTRTLTEGKN